MAEITLNIPDPIHDKIKKRAEQTNNSDIGLIIATLAITFSVSNYDDSKRSLSKIVFNVQLLLNSTL